MSERRNKLSSAPPLPTLSPAKEPETLEQVVTKSSNAVEGAEDVNGDVVTVADSFSDIPIRTGNKSKCCSYSIFYYNL